ncbi:MAG: TonB-dependent receptor [Vicinamibacteria bacterium]
MARRLVGSLILALVVAPVAQAGDGGVIGWVQDAKGLPMPGAMVSLFGKGLRGGGFVTLADSSGRFQLPALPAGSYTVRAIGQDRTLTRRVTVLPNQDSIFTLSFAALSKPDVEAARETGAPAERELRWLLRHKPRSVLEDREEAPAVRTASAPSESRNLLESIVPWIPELGGAVELISGTSAFGTPSGLHGADLGGPSLGSVQLKGRLPNTGRWSLGGLVADSETATWRMAAEFVLEPVSGHRIEAGTGYGTRYLEPGSGLGGPLDNRSVGAVFVHETWTLNDRFTVSGGARYSYVGFLTTRNHLNPAGAVEYRTGQRSRLRASGSTRTLAPGGELLSLSTLASTPAMAVALVGESVRAERVLRGEIAYEQRVGRASIQAFAFHEGVRDQLANDVAPDASVRTLTIRNGRGYAAQGLGLSVGRQLGDNVNASLGWSFGRSDAAATAFPGGVAVGDGTFSDVTARVETFIDRTDTRLVAYYRLSRLALDEDGARSADPTASRFDVRLTQGLPFLREMTRTEWELLLAFRNLFYEANEGALLDELTVTNPPKRVVGGISVRF